jgi:transposase
MNAYSQDLREKIVQAVFEGGIGKTETARTFGVSLSSVKRYARAASKGKCLAPKRRPGSEPKLDERARRLLAADVEERPFATLPERREYLKVVAGISVSNSTVSREIKRMAHTRKKGREGGRA